MGWCRRVWNLLRRDVIYRDIDRELSFHLESRIREFVSNGMTEGDARRRAARQFGNYGFYRERTRDMDISISVETFAKDVRYAFRGLLKNLSFTVPATLALALGIGANAAIFSVINGVLIKTLAYP